MTRGRPPARRGLLTVVATDLRDYGDSSKPLTTPDHAPYSKRTMARDQISVMRALGFEHFSVCGYDRRGLVAYRMMLNHPERVIRLAVLDIVPTWEAFSRADMAFGLGYWHWFCLAQPHDLPERLIGTDPTYLFLPWLHPQRGEPPRREAHNLPRAELRTFFEVGAPDQSASL